MPNIFTTGGPRTDRTAFELLGKTYQPTAGEVISAGFREGLEGPGSAIQDVATSDVAKELGREQELGIFQGLSSALDTTLFGALREDVPEKPSTPLAEEEWKTSPYFRDGLEYQVGMTTRAASILANTFDRKRDREFILSKSEGMVQGTLGIVGGLAGGMADAKNVAVSVAVAAATPLVVGGLTTMGPGGAAVGGAAAAGTGIVAGVARLGTTLTRLNSAGLRAIRASQKARIAAVVGEATVSTIPQVTTGLQNAPIIQQQYDEGDAALDFFASVGLGVGADYAGRAVGAAWRRYTTPDKATELGHYVMQQVKAGEKVDVKPLVASHIAGFTPSRVDVPEPTVRKMEDGRWEATLGPDSRERFVATTKESAVTAARESALVQSTAAIREAGFSPQAIARVEEALRAKMAVDPVRVEAEIIQSLPDVQRAKAQFEAAQRAFETAPKSKKLAAEVLVNAAKARVAIAEQAARPRVQESITQNRLIMERKRAEADDLIRLVQKEEAARLMPDYVKAQLDDSVEGQAARSIDPRATEIANDRIEPTKFDETAEPTPVADEVTAELERMAIDDPSIRESLDEARALDAAPDAIRQYAKCKAGT